MKHLSRLLAIALLITLSKTTYAQKIELINSGELIKKGTILSDSGQYKQALAVYNKISRNDTNYVRAVYEKAVTCEADSQYKQALQYCREALQLKEQREYEPDIYNTYGNVLNDMGQNDQALKIFDFAISKYPSYSLLYFNKGITLLSTKPHDAELMFQKALLINPYMYSAHYQLANAALKQGKIIPCFISLLGYLVTNPEGKYWSKSITTLAAISKSTDEILAFKTKRTTAPTEAYQEVEDILFSKIALENGYKPIIPIDDPIARQIQAVFEKIAYNQSDNDFWIQYYVPYFKQVFNDHKFELFIHQIFANVNIPVIQNYNKKNKKELDKFATESADYFNNIRATRQLNYTLRDTVTAKYYFENGKVIGKGLLLNKGKTLTGHWDFYYPAGNIKGRGEYNATGEREGEWDFYYTSGVLKSKERYVNGKLNGPQESYYENGNTASQANYANDLHDGITTTYFYAGAKKSITAYKADKKDGEDRRFYSNGTLKSINNYVAGAITGTSTEYFKNGRVANTEEFSNGKAEGMYKSYHENGSPSVVGQNVKDNGHGEWKYYYDSGKLKEKRTYVNDVDEGAHEEYNEAGQVTGRYNTRKGKMNGEANYYFDDGKVFSTFVYDNGVVKSAKYFDKTGAVLSSSELKNKVLNVVSYSINGHRKAHFTYDQKGNLDGPDTIFFASGKINQINVYKNGEMNGPSVSYYLNGNKKNEVNMTNGKSNGYYQSYYTNGKTEYEGWKQDGDSQGEWHYYDEKGRLSVKYYYLDNDLEGYKEDYLANGQKNIEQKYHWGWLEKMIQYDNSGKVMASDSFPKATGKYTLLYPNGKVFIQGNYVNGSFDGLYKTFFFDGSIQSTLFYDKGLKDSVYTSFHYGGAKYYEGRYKGGDKTGIWKNYNEDGKLFSTLPYNNDMLNGERTYYFPNGNKDLVSMFKDDVLNGSVKKYTPEGVLVDEVIFEDGDAKYFTYLGKDEKPLPLISFESTNGVLKTFFPNGKISREATYSDGVKTGSDKIYYFNGNIRSEDHTVYNVDEGPSKEYYPNGKLKSEYNYVNDNAEGEGKEYYENGSLKKEMTFDNGLNNGPIKYYNEAGKNYKTLNYTYGTLISAQNDK
jgi:antitoxin component YwqK of YwqJK toxin-antitoxin module/Tfp pilus assembly protein PilF